MSIDAMAATLVAIIAACGLALIAGRQCQLATRTWLAPDAVRHTWVGGIAYAGVLLLFLSGPWVIAGRPDLALAGAAATLILLCGPFRTFLRWVSQDLGEHRREGRGAFDHSPDCLAHHSHKSHSG